MWSRMTAGEKFWLLMSIQIALWAVTMALLITSTVLIDVKF